jgi:hypothetical protein
VSEKRKQAVSIRLGASDIRKVKRLAERLGVRDSDVIRFALKWVLNRVGPLCDPAIRGPSLVPMFVEAGAELIRYFELDAARLDAVINAGVDNDRGVAHDDIALLALAGLQQPYALLGLRQGVGYGGVVPANSIEALRQHLYDKYVYARADDAPRGHPIEGESPEVSGTLVALAAG